MGVFWRWSLVVVVFPLREICRYCTPQTALWAVVLGSHTAYRAWVGAAWLT